MSLNILSPPRLSNILLKKNYFEVLNMKNDYIKKRKAYISSLGTFYYLFYKDYSIDQLNSCLLQLYQSSNPFSFLEIYFLEILIEIRSSDII